MRIGSLFSGIGGLELGLERAGVGHVVWQVEIDEYCRSVLARHWPDAQRYDDVRRIHGKHKCRWLDSPRAPWPCPDCIDDVDVICGGFPCQDISYAGKGAGLAGERSGLWYEFARVVREVGPRFVVVENVAALLDRGMGDVLGTLADLGYDAEWSVVSACSVGAAHPRDRVFIIAHAERYGLQGGPTDAQEGQGEPREEQLSGLLLAGFGDAVSAARVWRESNGVPSRLDVPRNMAIGNAVVPQVAEVVGKRLLAIHRGRVAA